MSRHAFRFSVLDGRCETHFEEAFLHVLGIQLPHSQEALDRFVPSAASPIALALSFWSCIVVLQETYEIRLGSKESGRPMKRLRVGFSNLATNPNAPRGVSRMVRVAI